MLKYEGDLVSSWAYNEPPISMFPIVSGSFLIRLALKMRLPMSLMLAILWESLVILLPLKSLIRFTGLE